MDLQEYQQKKAQVHDAYIQRINGFAKDIQAAKEHMKATLAEMRTQVNFDLSNMPRINHDAHIRKGAHNVCRYITKVLPQIKWDAQEFAFDADNLQMGFDIDKENNQVTWHFTVPTVKH